MLDEHDFRRAAAVALDSLKRHLIAREDEQHAGLEVEDQDGALRVLFEKLEDKFVIAPNATVREIRVSATGSHFQLLWDSRTEKFIFPPTGENLIPLIDRLISEHH